VKEGTKNARTSRRHYDIKCAKCTFTGSAETTRDNLDAQRTPLLAMIVLAGLFASLQAGYAEAAATPATSGFWAGLGDGFLSLVKLIASLFANLTLFDREARTWSYDLGFGLGGLGFVALAGAGDSAFESDPQGWTWVDPQASRHNGLPARVASSSPAKMRGASEGLGVASGAPEPSGREERGPQWTDDLLDHRLKPRPEASWHFESKGDEDPHRSISKNAMQLGRVSAGPQCKTPRHE